MSESSKTRLSPVRDIAIVVAVTVGSALAAGYLELNERVFSLTRPWEHLQLDEWPIAMLALALSLMWLAWRRYRLALVEIAARQSAEAGLSAALAENRELARQHLLLMEAERKHLARELHDELGQYLNAIKLDAVAIGEQTGTDAEPVSRASERMLRAVNHVHGVVSDMIRRLRPVGLDELGLVAALESCVDQWRQRQPHTQFSFTASGEVEGLSEVANLTLYRLVQEGLTNSFKHAQARHIDVSLRRDPAQPELAGDVVLTVSDDGQGMNAGERKPGVGLGGMRERVEMMGGVFAVATSAGAGFRFEARLPAAGVL